MHSPAYNSLKEHIANRSARIGVVGLGYVGLPLALAFCEQGFAVLGFDVDAEKVAQLKRGEGYIAHLGNERVAAALHTDRFIATNDFNRLSECDAILVAVPTPLTRQREPEMQYIQTTCRHIATHLRAGQLIVLESTTYPGTTDELVRQELETAGKPRELQCGRDYFLAYSPEREDPGNAQYRTATIPKVVGGVDAAAGELASALYARVVEKVVTVSSARTAEATKLMENIFRAVNIALVNELKVVYDRMGIDIWEVLDAADTKPFGFMRFNPGPGLGGHCIPLDPFYLTWKAREYGIATRFIELDGEINRNMPHYVVQKLQDALNAHGKALKGSSVLILGLAYKRDVADPRESPSFELLKLLHERGAQIHYHDPHIPTAPAMRSWPDLPPLQSVSLTAERLRSADAVVIATAHSAVDYQEVAEHARLVIDTRGVLRMGGERVVKA